MFDNVCNNQARDSLKQMADMCPPEGTECKTKAIQALGTSYVQPQDTNFNLDEALHATVTLVDRGQTIKAEQPEKLIE